ncbi:MAG TPA: hypothetical protein VG147_01055 [Solirubrobacteraceae bacterium]|jgi:hypothetical protein|nr:hypothetical protein [Solirubrobacteraceae bacterium]
MLDTHTYVEGASLPALIFDVREQFLDRLPYELDEGRTPNSLHVVAIDVFEHRTAEEQTAILHDLVAGNKRLVLVRPIDAIFETADSPAAVLTDLVCEVVCQVLRRDPSLSTQDDWRILVAAESAEEADQCSESDALPPCDL